MKRKEFIEYMKEWSDIIDFCNDNGLEEFVDDIIHTDEIAKFVAKRLKTGWQGVKICLGEIKFMNDDYFKIDGYENLRNLTQQDMDNVKEEILDNFDKWEE